MSNSNKTKYKVIKFTKNGPLTKNQRADCSEGYDCHIVFIMQIREGI